MRSTKLSRSASHRRSLVKNLATSVLLYETVRTTPAKAKAIQAHAERLISTAKRWRSATSVGSRLSLYRTLLAATSDRLAAKKLIEVLADRYDDRTGGYTRRLRLARRLGDGAQQVVVSLTSRRTDKDGATQRQVTPVTESRETK